MNGYSQHLIKGDISEAEIAINKKKSQKQQLNKIQ